MGSKERRLSYSIAFKLEVMNYASEHGNRAAARHFGPPPTEKMIQEWRKQKIDLVNADKTRKLAVDMSIADFSGITSWCERFMKRNGLCMRSRTTIAQKLPPEYERKIIEFHKYVINLRKMKCFEIGQIGNMDEIPLTFDVPSNKTVDIKGAKTVMIKTSGYEKTRYTVVLACCADGSKLPPLLIFKRKTLPKCTIPHGIYIHVHPKGWMDGEGMKLWLQVWSKRPGGLLKKSSLLVCHQFKAHITESAKILATELKTHLAVIPGGLTSQLQPLDVSVNKPFKGFMHEEGIKWIEALTHDVTPTGRMKRPSISSVCEWVKKSWQKVKSETIIKSFKKCGISNVLDGSEDDILYEESYDSRENNCKYDFSSSDEEFMGLYDE
ncbi:hypothetical protein J437_LFUL004770 [Ladona fulva]|uniref:DDE-1 domain-containing protein n=1 Tax=Ladona fulva TaxID=123851 RepID=A0A8K0K031_LADFU|nr:hypothetical protein J437_LFUL004770 [Ladona fulva]